MKTDKKNIQTALQALMNVSDLEEMIIAVTQHFVLDSNKSDAFYGLTSIANEGLQALNQTIVAWERILTHPDFVDADKNLRIIVLNKSAGTYFLRYLETDAIEDLDYAISYWQELVAELPNDFDLINNLRLGLSGRYIHTKDLFDLEQSIAVNKKAIELTQKDSPHLSNLLNILGNDLRNRYDHTCELSDIEQSIATFEKAIALMPQNSSDFLDISQNLGNSLMDHYVRTSNLCDLKQGVEIYQKAINFIKKTTTDSPILPIFLGKIGEVYRNLYLRTGNINDLEDAIMAHKEAVNITLRDEPDSLYLPMFLGNLGEGLRTRYLCKGYFEDLEECIATLQHGINLAQKYATESPLPIFFNRLGAALNNLYIHTGNFSDLENSIAAYQNAIALILKDTPDSLDLPMSLSNLGIGLNNRYIHTGYLGDLTKSIVAFQEAVSFTRKNAPNLPDLPMFLSNLGTGLSNRYIRTGDIDDLKESIMAFQEAVSLTREDALDFPTFLNNLGCGLSNRYILTGDIDDLKESIMAFQEAVNLTRKNAPNSHKLPVFISSLGESLRSRYNLTGNLDDLEQSISEFKEAVSLAQKNASNSPILPILFSNLAHGFKDRYTYTGELSDQEYAIVTYEKATKNNFDVDARLLSARSWLRWAFTRNTWEEVQKVYGHAYKIIERLLQFQLLRQEKEIWLKETQGLAAQATYAFAKNDRFEQAAVTLESGLARLLSEALAIDRTNLDQLRETEHSYLINDYQQAVSQWYILTQKNNLSEQDLAILQSARENLDKTIETVRTIEGCENFLSSPDFEDIQAAAQKNPLVYVLATEAGGLALIVSETVRPVWLTKLTSERLSERLQAYLDACSEQGKRIQAWQTALETMTQWIWDMVMKPITKALPPDTDKVTMIPSGLLTSLPLHAACEKETGRYVSDILTLSYSPNARSLNEAHTLAKRVKADKMLAVDNPGGDLLSAEYEVQAAVSYFEHQIFRRKKAICYAVLKTLPDCNVLHFACHGNTNFENPLFNSLIMADGEITLQDIIELRLKGVRLAILSACATSVPGTELPDEIVSLPSGLLQAGVAGVIASLWMVDDLSTMILMTRFYEFWQKGSDPAEALKNAQVWIRNAKGNELADICERLYIRSKKMNSDLYIAIRRFKNRKDSVHFDHPYYWAGFEYVGV